MTTFWGRATLALAAAMICLPAYGQVDLTGSWKSRQHEDWIDRDPGPVPVDYLGIPLSDEGRAKALSYTAAQLAMTERQCRLYGPYYLSMGPQNFRIWNDTDPVTGRVIAIKISAAPDRDILTIWLDGRPQPSINSFYPFSGFTTGAWEGEMLNTYTTHIKAAEFRRNGVPASDQVTVTQHITRHGDILTILAVISDPIYLTEPYVLSRSWQLDPHANAPAVFGGCFPVTELPGLDVQGTVPHYLPGKTPNMDEVTKAYNIPMEAVLGYAETQYPEYRKKLKDIYVRPEKCVRYCCGWDQILTGPGPAPGLNCVTNGTGRIIR